MCGAPLVIKPHGGLSALSLGVAAVVPQSWGVSAEQTGPVLPAGPRSWARGFGFQPPAIKRCHLGAVAPCDPSRSQDASGPGFPVVGGSW